ncbi:MAG: chromate resistance protein ChrB domain-containing protein [Pseudomonadota bacterium]
MFAPHAFDPNHLLSLLGRPDCPQLLDVCLAQDFAEDPRVIPTATRISHDQISDAPVHGEVVVVCQKGLKLSQGAAARLRNRGVEAGFLVGGVSAWKQSGMPLIAATDLESAQLWVTGHRPNPNTLAAIWVVKRFICRTAEFMFVEPDQVDLVAQNFAAQTINQTGFEDLIDQFSLTLPALDKMAGLLRTRSSDAETAGLNAVLVGLALQHTEDLQLMDAALSLFDTIYRWAQDTASQPPKAQIHA